MKKYFLILLLIVLPLQYSWSATAVYCQHENGHVTHFGHHSHQHQTPSGDTQSADQSQKLVDDADGGSQSKKFHGDCEYCHMFSHASLLPAVPILAPPLAESHMYGRNAKFSSYIPVSQKPPDWPLVA